MENSFEVFRTLIKLKMKVLLFFYNTLM